LSSSGAATSVLPPFQQYEDATSEGEESAEYRRNVKSQQALLASVVTFVLKMQVLKGVCQLKGKNQFVLRESFVN
jgi:hypothetical protein